MLTHGKRCFDCLAPVPDIDDVLCVRCEGLYAAEKVRRHATNNQRTPS